MSKVRRSLKRIQARKRKFVKLCEPMREALAARRIGELVPADIPSEAGSKGGRGKKAPEEREALEIPTQRLSEFRKLAAGLTLCQIQLR